ncbi:MAG: hypothetical protein DDT22_00149 [candidate division WS2 bacterium]|nr:hypothetical protein [Candidatus Lithacetigena glycinireducens]
MVNSLALSAIEGARILVIKGAKIIDNIAQKAPVTNKPNARVLERIAKFLPFSPESTGTNEETITPPVKKECKSKGKVNATI